MRLLTETKAARLDWCNYDAPSGKFAISRIVVPLDGYSEHEP
jgi:hypothetical protein